MFKFTKRDYLTIAAAVSIAGLLRIRDIYVFNKRRDEVMSEVEELRASMKK